jgi:hypothetical protein
MYWPEMKKAAFGCLFENIIQADQAGVAALPRMAPNFWLNFSTRPAVSTIFCLPV